jgi:hypothetical protein
MQKVVGSSPIIRLSKVPLRPGFVFFETTRRKEMARFAQPLRAAAAMP